MYCERCGAKIDDNAKFCPSCGYRIVPEAPEPVITGAPEETSGISFEDEATVALRGTGAPSYENQNQNAYGAPQNPYDAGRDAYGGQNQNLYGAQNQNVYGADPGQNVYGVQNQNIYGAQSQNIYGAGPNPYGAAPYGGAPASPSPAPKKKKSGLLIGVIAALAVILLLGAVAYLNKGKVSNFFAKTFSSPEKYYQYVELKNSGLLTTDVTDLYKNAVHTVKDDQQAEYSISAEVSEELTDLLKDTTGESFDWLKSVSINGVIAKKEDMLSLSALAKLNTKELISLSGIYDRKKQRVYGEVPAISDDAFSIDLESDEFGGGYSYQRAENALEELENVLDSLPEKEELKALLLRMT